MELPIDCDKLDSSRCKFKDEPELLACFAVPGGLVLVPWKHVTRPRGNLYALALKKRSAKLGMDVARCIVDGKTGEVFCKGELIGTFDDLRFQNES